jgi:glycopeptide antibiotics resistance protein
MRFLLSLWIIIIFILTCTKDVYQLFEGKIEFAFSDDPHWSDLFFLEPWSQISWIEFVGHFFMFFILTALLITVFRNIPGIVVIAFLYGLLTELLQPFFSRGAEGIDLVANAVGIISFVMLYGVGKVIARNIHVKGSELGEGHARSSF